MKQPKLNIEFVNSADFIDSYNKLDKQIYNLADINEKDLTSGNLHYWKKLLLANRAKGTAKGKEWSRFSFTDYVWLKIILYLNEMEISKPDKIAAIKRCLENISFSIGTESALKAESNDFTGEDSEAITNRNAYKGLGILIAHSLITQSPYYIQVYKNGICKIEQREIEVSVYKPKVIKDSDTFLQIALVDIFVDFVSTMLMAGRGKEPMSLGIVSNGEGTLLEQLFYKLVIELTIKFKGQKDHSWPIEEVVNEEGVNTEFAYCLARCMVEANYQKITYKLYGGSTVWFSGKSMLPTAKKD